VKQRSDDLDIKQVCTTNLRSPPDGRVDERFATNALAGAALLRMIPIDLQSSRSVPLSKRFAAIPIGGYRPAVARRRPRGVTKAGRDRIARPRPEIRQLRDSSRMSAARPRCGTSRQFRSPGGALAGPNRRDRRVAEAVVRRRRASERKESSAPWLSGVD
jgi:hypothetical protein